MKFIYCFLLLSVVFLGCNHIDQSKPEAVVQGYLRLSINSDYQACYKLLSTKSKEIATYDEFKKAQSGDSIKLLKINKVEPLEKDLNFPTYRRFKASVTLTDSTNRTRYYTLINENNEWKIIWDKTLEFM